MPNGDNLGQAFKNGSISLNVARKYGYNPDIPPADEAADAGLYMPDTSLGQRPIQQAVTGLAQGAVQPVLSAGNYLGGILQGSQRVNPYDTLASIGGLASMFVPGARGEGMATRAAEGMAEAAPKGIRAYHGSPYDFNAFDLSKIGTGEGAQAYGHGLYFAEQPETARAYRDNLSNFNWNFDGSGKPIPSDLSRLLTDTHVQRPGLQPSDVMDLAQQELEAHRRQSLRAGDMDWYTSVNNTLDDLNHLRRDPPKIGGKMYEVNINAHPDEFLDWDKPLSEQSQHVKSASNPDFIEQNASKTPQQAYPYGINAETAQQLRDAGIPGIRYLDQGSRGAGDIGVANVPNHPMGPGWYSTHGGRVIPSSAGPFATETAAQQWAARNGPTHNYVVFDDKLIDIIKKYGLAGLIAGGAYHAQLPAGGPRTNGGT